MEKADLEHNSKSNIHCSLLWLGRPVAFRDHWTVQAELMMSERVYSSLFTSFLSHCFS